MNQATAIKGNRPSAKLAAQSNIRRQELFKLKCQVDQAEAERGLTPVERAFSECYDELQRMAGKRVYP